MEIDTNYLANFAQKPDRRDPRSEREYYLNLCIEKINTQRKQENEWSREQNDKLRQQGKEPIYKTFPPVAPRNIVFKVSHLKTPALKDFYYKCEKADNFSRCFFGSQGKAIYQIQCLNQITLPSAPLPIKTKMSAYIAESARTPTTRARYATKKSQTAATPP